MKNIPPSPPSNSFHVIAPLALFAVPENSFPRYKTGARKCTPNRVFFQKSSQSLCLLPISLYQSRRTSRAEKKDRLGGNRFLSNRIHHLPPLLVPSVEIDLTVSPLSRASSSPRHRLLSRRNEPKSRGGGGRKNQKNTHGETKRGAGEVGLYRWRKTRFSVAPIIRRVYARGE